MISAWLGQNSTSGSGVLSVTGWHVDNTDPQNPVIIPAGLFDVLSVSDDAGGLEIRNIDFIEGIHGSDLFIYAVDTNDGLTLLDGDGWGWYLKSGLAGLNTMELEVANSGGGRWAQINTVTGTIALGDIDFVGNTLFWLLDDQNGYFAFYSQNDESGLLYISPVASIGSIDWRGVLIDIPNDVYHLGNFTAVALANVACIDVDDAAKQIQLKAGSSFKAIADNATARFNISGAGAAYAVNGAAGITTNQVFKDGAGVNKTMTITGGIITAIA